ncbi:MAG TPA: sialate O-acetylesterase [Planctomycetaceae bacterium]|nr:sialate O-acetylesterase [Planctomycetaceae bacterium]
MKTHCSRFLAVLAMMLVFSFGETHADVQLPSVFSEHMVLQQQQKIRIWGWADAGEAVSVAIGSNTASAKADDSGRWQVDLASMTGSNTPVTISVKGNNTVEIKDVLIGEVWLCSGQSNMEWTVASSTNAQEELAAAKYPMIRHIKVPLVQSTVPLDNFNSSWQVCSPETVGGFTACGYFMARKLHQELDVPVGLVNSSWGGTRVEPWTPPVGFQHVAALQDIYLSVIGRTPGTPQYRDRLSAHIKSLEEWIANAKNNVSSLETLAPSPNYPAELIPFTSNQDPTMLYNGMIHSLVGFPIRGAIWYQGESNHTEGMLYFEKKQALIDGWRELWGQGDFPFYYVQIAPFQYGNEDPTILAKFWEAQAAVQQIPNTGMVVINDIATLNNIHPPNKQDVGLRLAQLALKNDYGKTDVVANSPEFSKLDVLSDRLKITFRNSGGGLKTRDGKSPSHFELIGVGSNGFQPAMATIEGDAVILTSEKVTSPTAFRFAWHMLAEPNLCGGTGLPVGAFRGGEVPDFLSALPIAKEYQLVYDLNLEKLAHDIKYDVDHGSQIRAFDRVGYLLELITTGGEMKNVFVSMDAFTDDVKKIGIPTVASGAAFQQSVKSMDVYSDVTGIRTGTSIEAGNIEFWPDNYAMPNAGKVTGASDTAYDFGDEIFAPHDGYGSMQIHNNAAGQTLFAINHWIAGGGADIGIGNSEGQTRDWTFTGNAGSYSAKRLRVFVRSK